MSKHAPAPWRRHLVDDTTIIDRDGRFVASVCGGDDDLGDVDYNNPGEWPVLEATASLIAAAPDLLEALHEARAALNGAPNTVGLHDQINAAIAKAEGRS